MPEALSFAWLAASMYFWTSLSVLWPLLSHDLGRSASRLGKPPYEAPGWRIARAGRLLGTTPEIDCLIRSG
jgi:hypothetical protein